MREVEVEGRSIKDILRYVLELASLSVVCSLVVCLVHFLTTIQFSRKGTWSPLREPLSFEAPVIMYSFAPEHRLAMLSNWFLWHMLSKSFWPVALLYYLGPKRFTMRVFTVIFVSPLMIYWIGYYVLGIHVLMYIFAILQAPFLIISSKMILPEDSRIPKELAYHLLGYLLTLPLIFLPHILPMDKPTVVAIYFGVLFPVFREGFSFLGAKSAWYLTSDAQVAGTGVEPNREDAWVFVAYIKFSLAVVYRSLVANIDDPIIGWGLVIWQGLVEIFLRLTLQTREEWITTYTRQCMGQQNRRGTVTVVPSSAASFTLTSITAFAKRGATSLPSHMNSAILNSAKAKVAFYSTLVQMDMISEYVGIIVSCCLIIYWKKAPLFYPFQEYRQHILTKDTNPDSTNLLLFCVLSLVTEVGVDTICVVFERGTDPYAVWKTMNKRRFIPLLVTALNYAACLAFGFLMAGDDYLYCYGKNLCYCVNHGLQPGGVRDTYCKVMYPNVTWDTDGTNTTFLEGVPLV